MNKKFKFLTVLLALVMTLGAFAPFSAVKAADATETKTVTLHKLLMTKDELDAWDSDKVEENGYDATQDLAGLNGILKNMQKKEVSEIAGVYFVLKFADGNNAGKFVKKGADALTPADPIEATDDIEQAVGGLTTATGLVFNTSKLEGNFIIDEVSEKSTYQGDKGAKLTGSKAVPVEITLPLVNNNGIVENAHVYPKNIEDRPKIDKNFAKDNGLTSVIDPETNKDVGADYANYEKQKAKATAEIGKEIKYEVMTFLPENAKYKTVIWKDSMTDGLTYNYNLNISGLKDADGKDFV